ncbi:MAG TPA: hypothetical protein VEI97_08920, partial [bacterium]|nr:hypothetical protein [bacterium]
MDPQAILGPLGWVGTAALAATVVWLLANPRIRALARLTWMDSLRRMEFQAVLLIAVVLLLGIGYLNFVPDIKDSPLWGFLLSRLEQGAESTPGIVADAQREFQANFNSYLQAGMMFFAEFFTLAMLFALGVQLIAGDIQQGFLLTVLPKPTTRGEYLWGRGLGVLATVTAAWLTMAVVVFLVFAAKEPSIFRNVTLPEWKILWGAALLVMKWASFLAFLLLFTVKLPPVAGGILALLLFGFGHISGNLRDVGSDATVHPTIRAAAWGAFVLMPHYERSWSATIL